MQLLRITLGYSLASLVACLVMFLAYFYAMGALWGLASTLVGLWATTGHLVFYSAILGGIMLIPTLIFLWFAWGQTGPRLRNCLLFFGVSSFLSGLVVGLSGGVGDIGLILSIALTFSFAGLCAALVFWFVAVWHREDIAGGSEIA